MSNNKNMVMTLPSRLPLQYERRVHKEQQQCLNTNCNMHTCQVDMLSPTFFAVRKNNQDIGLDAVKGMDKVHELMIPALTPTRCTHLCVCAGACVFLCIVIVIFPIGLAWSLDGAFECSLG